MCAALLGIFSQSLPRKIQVSGFEMGSTFCTQWSSQLGLLCEYCAVCPDHIIILTTLIDRIAVQKHIIKFISSIRLNPTSIKSCIEIFLDLARARV